jgi:YHS domain-containing protein
MKSPSLIASVLLSVTIVATQIATAQDQPATEKPTAQATRQPAGAEQPPILCPVTGKPIDKAVFTRFRGKRVYFADQACIAKFRENPGEYAEGLKTQWKHMRPLRVQVTCPVTGETIDKRFFVEMPDDDLYFASEQARAAWEKDSKPYEQKLDDCYTFQTHCGTCPGDFNPQAMIEYESRKIYFCCMGCGGVFKKDPQKFIEKYDAEVAANKAAWQKLHPAKTGNADRDDD